jgi:lipoprotein signal peptidase
MAADRTIGFRLKMNTKEQMAANWLAGVARIAAWVLAAIIVILSLVPPVFRPETGVLHNLEHFAIYAVAGLAFGVGYNRSRGILAVLLVIFSGCVEIAQLFVPGRHARLSDFAVDAIAMCAGVGVGSVLDRIRKRS